MAQLKSRVWENFSLVGNNSSFGKEARILGSKSSLFHFTFLGQVFLYSIICHPPWFFCLREFLRTFCRHMFVPPRLLLTTCTNCTSIHLEIPSIRPLKKAELENRCFHFLLPASAFLEEDWKRKPCLRKWRREGKYVFQSRVRWIYFAGMLNRINTKLSNFLAAEEWTEWGFFPSFPGHHTFGSHTLRCLDIFLSGRSQKNPRFFRMPPSDFFLLLFVVVLREVEFLRNFFEIRQTEVWYSTTVRRGKNCGDGGGRTSTLQLSAVMQ